ncbi:MULTISPECIES: VOC family protein [Streptomyces]|uniref:Putative lactoylglutathione lyase n=1 Tax=Streptomyces stelliscabiei TaxID=146820 RepID=A0A8I0PDD1_9ACTN|nr:MULTISPECIES: VOC family protein [Streptomyces]KND42292.1 glyoxalase [Streptomyces stelliscabiei]MBE1600571.1 putative lactoylglutathione lyase [Streptomyces stelliscabiei]MDX2518386.1 VOC family protein [Streptomyces stelliscabiei]MDX2554372.1 VOC family protein [Streptomyces stelliscabiei]MDX2613581.1 VOC family protein [Streptomyces stelliscabiei]
MYQQMIFINLPVNDLDASKKFFTELGYTLNPQFSDENAASVVISDTIVAMLLTKPFYSSFTNKEIADATRTSEVMLCLSAESRAKVDELVEKAVAAGGTASEKVQEMDFMYGRAFDDLDGHTWEVVWMDPAAIEG